MECKIYIVIGKHRAFSDMHREIKLLKYRKKNKISAVDTFFQQPSLASLRSMHFFASHYPNPNYNMKLIIFTLTN